jgi:phosphatidate cytidylyltransferase
MLWQRVITALVLMPLIIAAILLLDSHVLAIVLGAALLVAAHEMARLANLRSIAAQLAFVAAVALSFALTWYLLFPDHLVSLQWAMSAWWLVITLALVFRRTDLPRVDGQRPGVLLLGALILVSAWLSVLGVHAAGDTGPYFVLLLFGLIWLADSGAYFAGRAFGTRKLSPHVSPGKTWAGVVGAVVAVAVGVGVLAMLGWPQDTQWLPFAALGILVTLVSIGGDLWESRLKREAGLKDSGSLLPGHGGMLDRIDSLLAAAPVFGLGLGLSGAVA